ncbi:MAG: phosphatase PAP2 family protein [Muribaculaceae bacterium]
MARSITAALLIIFCESRAAAITTATDTIAGDSITTATAVIVADSITDGALNAPCTPFAPRQLIVPGAVIAIGVATSIGHWFDHVNEAVRDGMSDLRGDHYFHADDYLQYVPVAAYLGMGACGIKSRHGIVSRLMAGATAYAAMGIMVNVLKYTVKEPRPDSGARNSMPSGHTATAFMGAELVRLEYGTVYAIGAYCVSAGIAFCRLYNDRHWLNDVIMGAGIGILSARIGYWMLQLYRKWLKLNSHSGKAFAAAPAFEPGSRSLGIALCATF